MKWIKKILEEREKKKEIKRDREEMQQLIQTCNLLEVRQGCWYWVLIHRPSGMHQIKFIKDALTKSFPGCRFTVTDHDVRPVMLGEVGKGLEVETITCDKGKPQRIVLKVENEVVSCQKNKKKTHQKN